MPEEHKHTKSRIPAWIPFVLVLLLLGSIGLVVYFFVLPNFYSTPVITVQPEDKRVAPGELVTLSITAAGNPAPTYQWQVNPLLSTSWTNIAGATNASYTFTAKASDQSSQYRVVVTNSSGSTSSQVWVITVTLPPSIVSTPPALITVQVGSPVTLAAVATGNPAPNYQWQVQNVNADANLGFVNLGTSSNESDGTFTFTPSFDSSGSQYCVIVSNTFGSVTSSPTVINVTPILPTFGSTLVTSPTRIGTSALFSIAIQGMPTPTCQWQRQESTANTSTGTGTGTGALVASSSSSWINIVGAPTTVINGNSILTLANMQASDDGDLIRVIVTNAGGTITSTATPISVFLEAAISTSPANASVVLGNASTFTVSATGYPIPTLTWQTAANVIGSTFISQAATSIVNSSNTTSVTSTFVYQTTSPQDNGMLVRVIAANASATTTSNTAVLLVTMTSPSITSSPLIATTASIGTNLTFSCTATGNPLPTLQWQLALATNPGVFINVDNTTVGASASASTSTSTTAVTVGTLTLVASSMYQGAYVRATASNAAGSVTGNAALITVQLPPSQLVTSFDTTPTSVVVLGINPTLTLSVISCLGTPAPAYQWLTSPDATSSFNILQGQTGASLVLVPSLLLQGRRYCVQATNIVGSVISTAVTSIVVQQLPTFAALTPSSQTVNAGQAVTFSCNLTAGLPSPTLQWQAADASFSPPVFVNIAGATSTSYTLSTTSPNDTNHLYVCVATNAAAPAGITSASALLTVNAAAPAFILSPLAQTVTIGQAVTFTCSVSGIPTPILQWCVADASLGTPPIFTPIANATGTSYTISATTVAHTNHLYAAFASNVVQANVASASALLTVNSASPTFTLAPTAQSVTVGQPVSFTCTVSGIPTPTLQWYMAPASTPLTFSPILGATAATLTLASPTDTTSSTNGQMYQVVATNLVAPAGVASVPVSLTVYPLPPSFYTNLTSEMSGDSGATLVLAVVTLGADTLQWQMASAATPTLFQNLESDTTTSASLTVVLDSALDQSIYRVLATNTGGTTISNTTTITVTSSP
jgi:hypothetical protein